MEMNENVKESLQFLSLVSIMYQGCETMDSYCAEFTTLSAQSFLSNRAPQISVQVLKQPITSCTRACRNDSNKRPASFKRPSQISVKVNLRKFNKHHVRSFTLDGISWNKNISSWFQQREES